MTTLDTDQALAPADAVDRPRASGGDQDGSGPGDALRTLARPVVQRARYRARRTLDRIDNEPVRLARHLLQRVRREPLDVLYLGDSTSSFVGPNDTDRRRLPQMVADDLGDAVGMHVIKGASFNTNMYAAYLGLLRATSHRPLVVASLAVRSHSPTLVRHPVHGHHRALAAIRSVDPERAAWHVHGAWPPPTQADFEIFHREPHATLLDEGTMGGYRERIGTLERGGDAETHLRVLYDYLHGGALLPDSEGLEAVEGMGRTLRSLGCDAVLYLLPIPMERGSELLGAEFRARSEANVSALVQAYRRTAGDAALVVESGTTFVTAEFLDPCDGTEHLNARGRQHLAHLIVGAVRARLAAR